MTLRIEAGDSGVGSSRERLREADRLAGREIGFDDPLEDIERPPVEAPQSTGIAQRLLRRLFQRTCHAIRMAPLPDRCNRQDQDGPPPRRSL